jgi:hypothetical protein
MMEAFSLQNLVRQLHGFVHSYMWYEVNIIILWFDTILACNM